MFAMSTASRRGSAKRAASVDRASASKAFKVDYSIPINNRFSALPNQDAKAKAQKPPAPAPITITDKFDPTQVLKTLKIQFRLKIISVGTKIFTNKVEDFNLLCKKLNELKVEFYTHPPDRTKFFKLMLHGLPEVPTDDIIEQLNSQNNVKASKIVMLRSDSSFKRYIVQFDPKENSKADVKNVKVILNHIISWLPVRKYNRGPTQCLNCGMFGHGISACFRKPKCILCGGDHEFKNCTFDSESNDQRIFKCHNCKINNLPHNHKANDSQCPSRLKYIEIKAKANKKSDQNPNTRYVHSAISFPPLPPPLNRTFADAARPQKQFQTNIRHAHSNENDNELFTFAEISEIMLNCVNDLTKCTCKLDQLKVIANLLSNVCK